jgi:hypothetical protein
MSSVRAIAVITSYLRDQIKDAIKELEELTEIPVTVGPPDKTRGKETHAQLNLFLYQVVPDPAWRNRDIPGRAKCGEVSPPWLTLRLGYLLTVFGKLDNDLQDDVQAHQLLGSAMRRIQDRPELPRDFEGMPPAQPDPPRITFQPLSPDEMQKVWSGLQSPYRLSVAYDVGPVLIESRRPAQSAPPVLSRGEVPNPGGAGDPSDPGFHAQPSAPPATIRSLTFPPGQSGVRLKDTLVIQGDGLERVNLLEFRHTFLHDTNLLTPVFDRAEKKLTAVIPNAPEKWPAGIWTVALARCLDPQQQDRRDFTSQPVPFALMPTIQLPVANCGGLQRPRLTVHTDPQGKVDRVTAALDLDPGPRIVERPHPVEPLTVERRLVQQVAFFAGARELPMLAAAGGSAVEVTFESIDAAAAQLALAAVQDQDPNQLFVRVRVDGADSSLLKLPFNPKTDKREYDRNLILEVPP